MNVLPDSQQTYPAPYLLPFSRLGAPDIGYITVVESLTHLPFAIARTFWTYFTPESIVRGRHAHYRTEQVLVALAGRIIVTTEQPDGTLDTFRLESPDTGLYIPPNVWHTMQYSHTAVQLVLTSTAYDEGDYIRDYEQFRKTWRTH
ncbi:sugar 3,4-ketoisomerase [Hymenobacter sediminicola]|uniref:FdtA/QdtA family cupin domain-containing protein n=1 Tax=Hymenobacter sediminicola TaxID=2761579 RepID=A0A7G7W541_9BACT|nr:FdtA/QdtA family cupin domain-containing protein [Hymenobacter sediminicola]QNH61484.1 FdtA/QdtA family cupin domain-containing protein [Hymenobacter sediminicola]